jgi:CHAT domain-containing protein
VKQLKLGIESRQIRRETPGPAATLYDHLVRPIVRRLPPESRLAIVPDRFLAQVPFAVLFDASNGRFLIEDRVTTIQASASLFSQVERRPQGCGATGLLAVGDPAFDRSVYGSLVRLQYAAAEARQIAALYGNAVLLTGSAATRGAFVREASDAGMIHVAGHALADPREPRRSSLVLGPDGPGESGALSAAAVAGLDLRGTGLVVLSVCRGVAGGAAGRESVSGLAAGFLAAGARTVVASLWDASDASTYELMIEFHRRFRAGESPAQALRSVQLAALSRGDPPVTWAGFTVFGTDGSSQAGCNTYPSAGHSKRRGS